MKHRIWWRMAVAIMIPLLAFVGATPARAEVDFENVKRSVVWVDSMWEGTVTVLYTDNSTKTYDSTYLGMCSGWIVSAKGHIATAGHCVRPTDNTRVGLIANVIKNQGLTGANGAQLDPYKLDWKVTINQNPTIRINQPASISGRVFTEYLTAQLLDSQDPEAGDNALVQVVDFDTSKAVLPVATTAPKVLDKVVSIGFPQDTAGITEVNRQDPTPKSGSISSKTKSKKGVPMLQFDGEIIGGMSGGPTVNQNNEVVGINSASFTGTNQSYVTDTDTLRAFLQRNSVPLTEGTVTTPGEGNPGQPADPTPVPAADSGIPLWAIVLGLIGLAVVVLLGVLLLRRKPAQQASLSPQQFQQFPPGQPSHGNPSGRHQQWGAQQPPPPPQNWQQGGQPPPQ